MMFVNIGSAASAWKAGQVNALAIASSRRLARFPEVPTVAESGVPGFEAQSWFGLFAPRATPREIVGKINAEVQRIFNEPEYRERVLVPNTLESLVSSSETYEALIKKDTEKWGRVIGAAKLKIE